MAEWLYLAQLWISVSGGLFALGLGLLGRLPSLWSLGALVLVELGLLIQLAYSSYLVIGGARAEVDTVEFFAYLVVAIMVPIGAGFWALVERNRWSTVILGATALTIAVMLVRMNQIWTGTY
jgi:hypothetical protein